MILLGTGHHWSKIQTNMITILDCIAIYKKMTAYKLMQISVSIGFLKLYFSEMMPPLLYL